MILARRILPFIAPTLFACCFFGILSRVELLWWWIGVLAVCVLLTCGFLLEWKIFSARFFWTTLPLLIVLLTSSGVMIMVPNEWIPGIYALVAVALSGVYIEDVFMLNFQPQKYTQLSLPQFSLFLNVWSAYGVGLILFTLSLLNIISLPWMLGTAAVLGAYLAGHTLWSFSVWKKEMWIVPIAAAVLMVQYVWIFSVLPLSFVVSAFVLCVIVYVFTTLLQLAYRNAFTIDTVLRPVIISGLGTLAVLFTTQWFY